MWAGAIAGGYCVLACAFGMVDNCLYHHRANQRRAAQRGSAVAAGQQGAAPPPVVVPVEPAGLPKAERE